MTFGYTLSYSDGVDRYVSLGADVKSLGAGKVFRDEGVVASRHRPHPEDVLHAEKGQHRREQQVVPAELQKRQEPLHRLQGHPRQATRGLKTAESALSTL